MRGAASWCARALTFTQSSFEMPTNALARLRLAPRIPAPSRYSPLFLTNSNARCGRSLLMPCAPRCRVQRMCDGAGSALALQTRHSCSSTTGRNEDGSQECRSWAVLQARWRKQRESATRTTHTPQESWSSSSIGGLLRCDIGIIAKLKSGAISRLAVAGDERVPRPRAAVFSRGNDVVPVGAGVCHHGQAAGDG